MVRCLCKLLHSNSAQSAALVITTAALAPVQWVVKHHWKLMELFSLFRTISINLDACLRHLIRSLGFFIARIHKTIPPKVFWSHYKNLELNGSNIKGFSYKPKIQRNYFKFYWQKQNKETWSYRKKCSEIMTIELEEEVDNLCMTTQTIL